MVMVNHPHPQMKRDTVFSLDGEWYLNGGTIQVPYPPQSKLSGYKGHIGDVLVYEKRFMIPESFDKKRVLLHFGAVDQVAEVYLNGKHVGRHEGGYLEFTIDITRDMFMKKENFLQVIAEDTCSTIYPYGKQSKNPQGMWYTAVSGIWKSVWLEAVPRDYIRFLKMTPDLSGVTIQIYGATSKLRSSFCVKYEEYGEVKEQKFTRHASDIGLVGRLTLESPHLWTCEDPYLYHIVVTYGEDEVSTYFALRTISICRDHQIARVYLNQQPIFLHGVLDQGYFPKGIYVPEDAKDYERDILYMKRLGFNCIRKHIKVESESFYYDCDRLGMLVIQDMVNSGKYDFFADTLLPYFQMQKRADKKRLGLGQHRADEKERRHIFIEHTKQTMIQLYNHPSVIIYTIFNEGWGQFESDKLYDMAKQIDRTRLIDSTSGWFPQQRSDFDSRHQYFKNRKIVPSSEKPILISECGGYGLRKENHLYFDEEDKIYQYGGCKDEKELTDKIMKLYEEMILPGIEVGVCGCIYTQLSDVEGEVNGLYTYDRALCKVDAQRLKELACRIKKTLSDSII